MYGIVMAVTNLKLCTEGIEPLVKRIGTCIPMKACQPASLMVFYLTNIYERKETLRNYLQS